MADHPMEHAKLHLQYSYIQIYYAYTQTGTKKNQLTEEKKCHNHIGAQVIIMCWPLTSTTYSSSVCFFTALTLLCCDIVQNILLFSPEKLWMIMGGGEILSHPRWVYRRPCCRLILIFKTWKWPGPSQATKETSSGCVSVCFKVRGHSPLAHTNPNIPSVIPLIHSCV